MGDIGKPKRKIEFEPMPDEEPLAEPMPGAEPDTEPAEPAPAKPVPVPA
jgi:hypothetical protein